MVAVASMFLKISRIVSTALYLTFPVKKWHPENLTTACCFPPVSIQLFLFLFLFLCVIATLAVALWTPDPSSCASTGLFSPWFVPSGDNAPTLPRTPPLPPWPLLAWLSTDEVSVDDLFDRGEVMVNPKVPHALLARHRSFAEWLLALVLGGGRSLSVCHLLQRRWLGQTSKGLNLFLLVCQHLHQL